ncbi:MAG: 3-phosphoserine/phosphohydroxythreonine transaminase [Bacteroidetes bacterium]|nr:3-phosphoserine/phosphohydroxythreonine transaminase [Bacteroidota bacterium]
MKKINFYSGPAILPPEVVVKAGEAIQNFAGTGLSILEISHRSKEFIQVMEEARNLVRELMDLDKDHEVLFLQGGASSQFYMVPMNLLGKDETACFLETGQWAHLAMEEALTFGKAHIACSSKEENYRFIPKNISLPDSSKYLHLTTNNTIYGTQLTTSFISQLAAQSSWLVADMSSDIFSRQMDFNQFDLIYASAQKNVGAAGITIVVVNKNILGTVDRPIPKMLDYRLHIERDSMYNTPSSFAVYISYLTLKWIKQQGLKAIEERNIRKARKLYEVIDSSKIFEGTADDEDQSLMNVCFTIKDKSLEEKFLKFTSERGIVGIKGYRTVGGFRASIYNAMPEDGVDILVDAIKEFENKQA